MESTSARSIAYAVRELGRRAGAPAEWIAQWSVTVSSSEVAVSIDPLRDACLRFPFDVLKPQRYAALRDSPPAVLEWPQVMPPQTAAQNCVVPFADPVDGPLFVISGDEVRFRADVLTAVLWTLSRYEETREIGGRDEHGRFSAAHSHAGRYGYLDRPVVDEIALGLAAALRALFPSWKRAPVSLRVKVSHDIDLVGLPRSVRTIAGHLFTRRSPRAFATDAISVLTGGSTAYLSAALELHRLSSAHGFTSAFYWMAAARRTDRDVAYDVAGPLVARTIERLSLEGAEHGIHPGYDTFDNEERLRDQTRRLRTVIGEAAIGGRQHYLRWSPASWGAWERAGLAYDASVGFAEDIGFRAGTAYPYHPWLIAEDRESALLEVPLHVMDCSPIAYMGLGESEALTRVSRLIEQCRAVGGVFSLLWHNTSIIEQPYARLYPRILNKLYGAPQYDWNSDRALGPLPRIIQTAAAP